jgi:hypothetical protein
VCASASHHANDCSIRDRIIITGKNAEEVGYEAIHQQPYFDDPVAEVWDQDAHEVDDTKGHTELCWYDCKTGCEYYKKDKKDCRTDQERCCHMNLWADECLADNCYLHEPEKVEIHQRLLWPQCRNGCSLYREQFEKARQVDDYYHATILSNICEVADCPIY